MQTYHRWPDVPENLKTKTQLQREKLRPGGEPVAHFRSRFGTYDLYDKSDARPARQCSPAQLAVLARARETARQREQERWEVEQSIEHLDHELMLAGDREHAVLRARKLLALPPEEWCILDTETTGLEDDAEAIQIGILAPDGTPLLDTLVQPQQAQVGEGARQVHGITDEQLSTAPTFAEVYPALKRAIEGKVVVIYNKQYDKRILYTGYRLAGLPKISVTGYRCAMVLYAEYYGEWSARYEDYKFQALRGDHTAIGDCRAVLDILHRMAQDDAALTRWAALKAQLDRLHERQRELEPR